MITIQESNYNQPKINQSLILRAVNKTFSHFDRHDIDITIRFTGNEEIKALNQDYRGISEATDVLSFTQDIIDPETKRLYLGDIIISVEKARSQSSSHNLTMDQECAYLAIHGTLHLLGYDHYKPDEKEQMWQIQDKIFQETINEIQEKEE